MNKTGISAIVATLNRKDELKRLFDSVLESTIANIEIIVVDQNNNDLLYELLESYRSKLDIIHLTMQEANQSKARNYGASRAKYDIICFPDDDCWFEKEALSKVADHFIQKPATELLIINWLQNPYQHAYAKEIKKKDINSFQSVGYVTYVLFFKNEIFNSLGGFIENIGIGQYIGGGEDSELTFRAAHNNIVIYYESAIGVNHKYIPITTRELKVIRARQRGMGMVYANYDIPYFIILKGVVAPLIKMVLSLNRRKASIQYNIFRGRVEGFIHTKKNRNHQLQQEPVRREH